MPESRVQSIMLRRIILASLSILVAVHCANPFKGAVQKKPSDETDASIAVSLCAVVENPAVYDGKRVTMTGCVTTDGFEHVVLSNIERPCSRGGIVPVEAPTLRHEQRIDPQPGKRVCGTFTGTFRASNGLFDRVLEVEETSLRPRL